MSEYTKKLDDKIKELNSRFQKGYSKVTGTLNGLVFNSLLQ